MASGRTDATRIDKGFAGLFFPALMVVMIVILLGSVIGGARMAKRIAWAAAMVAPAWLARSVGSLDIDLRLVTLIALIPICLWEGRWIRNWSIVDGLVAGLAIAGFVSLQRNHALVPSECLVVISTWIVPYFMGRLVVETVSDTDRLIPYACAVCVFLSVWSIVESTTGVNPLNLVADRGGSRIAEQNLRFNLRRAEGPLGHPIYFGMTLAMLCPWTLEAARRALSGQVPKIFAAAPVICAAGVFCTLSRGPLLVLVTCLLSAAFFWQPSWRVPIIGIAVVSLLFVCLCWPLVVDGLQAVSGESPGQKVIIDGQEYEYSGTRHRTLLYIAYADALDDAGWIGHGKWGSKPHHFLYLEPHLRRTFRSIDNHYILLILNWGTIGLVLFLAFGIAAIGISTRASFDFGPDHRVLLGSLTGTVSAVMLLLLTVWFSSGFAFCWLSSLGMLVSAANSKGEMPVRLRNFRNESNRSRGRHYAPSNVGTSPARSAIVSTPLGLTASCDFFNSTIQS